jgi:hypothetical protein
MSSVATHGADKVRSHPPPDPWGADIAEVQIAGANLLLWGFRNVEIMMELNQALFSIGCDLLNRQQEAITAMLSRSMQAASEVTGPGKEDGIASAAQASMQAFNRVLAAMQVGSDPNRVFTKDFRQAPQDAKQRSAG